MISRRSQFKFFDRGCGVTTLLVPGWATDYRIFDTLDLNANYLMPVQFSPFNFNEDLLAAMARYGLGKISIMGWSMGAFAVSDFLSGYRDRVNDAVLISVRKKYERQKLKDIMGYLNKNRKAFLYSFYRNCFSKNEEREYTWFRDNLLKNYLEQISLKSLLEGLDYLLDSEIKTETMEESAIRLVHGEEDRIAPMKEILELKEELPDAVLTVIDNSGHMPFLNPNFREIFGGTRTSYG